VCGSEIRAAVRGEPHERFVDEGRRLERLAGALARDVPRRDASQLHVDRGINEAS
jgi:hypothetical protein